MKIRKLIALVAVATMVASTMVGCGGDTKSKDKDTNVSTEATTETTETTEADVENTTETADTADTSDTSDTAVENTTETETEAENDAEATEAVENETAAEDAPVDTVALKLYDVFEASVESATDLEELANTLANNEMFNEVSMTTMVIEPGFLNGFTTEIKEFNNGVMVAPIVGTIPFVCYVFETDATEALVGELEANHDLRWNICTEADEMLVKAHGNYVFFVMSPYNFEG